MPMVAAGLAGGPALFRNRVAGAGSGLRPAAAPAIRQSERRLPVRTTIDAKVGRRGGAYSVEELENSLNRARKALTDTTTVLELETERLFGALIDPDDLKGEDAVRYRALLGLLAQVQKAIQTVIEIENKFGISAFDARHQLDLEAARAEILERIRRTNGELARSKKARAA